MPDLVPDPAGFLADVVYRRALLSPCADAGRDPARFATADRLWDDALRRGLRTPGFRLVRDGRTLDAPTVTRRAGVGSRTIIDVIQPNRVLEEHRAGATMVLQGLQLSDPHLARVANNLALDLDQPVQVNAYLTPAGTKGLELHFDYHDVFVLQLDGAKRWRVWEPLDRTRDPVRGGPAIARPTSAELGPPALDLVLRAGDCLYLPRGFPHAAEAVDEVSSHLTIGVMAITWQRALAGVAAALAGDPATSPSLPAGLLAGDAPASLADGVIAVLGERFASVALRRWIANEIWRRQPATRLRPRGPAPAGTRTALAWTPGPLLWLTIDGGRTRLGLGERELDLPLETHAFLAALLDDPAAGVAAGGASDELDELSRRTVVERLVAEGALAGVAEAGGAPADPAPSEGPRSDG